MAVILRYSPRLPRYSSMATSLKDFCPKYFFQPLCIFPGRRRRRLRRRGRQAAAPRGALRGAALRGAWWRPARLPLMRPRPTRPPVPGATPGATPGAARPGPRRAPAAAAPACLCLRGDPPPSAGAARRSCPLQQPFYRHRGEPPGRVPLSRRWSSVPGTLSAGPLRGSQR